MANSRANETLEASLQRKQSNKEHMIIARANEAPLVSKERIAKDASCKRSARNATTTINDAISNFLLKIRLGPNFVCTVCHRMMYSTNVVSFDRSKYCKGTPKSLKNFLITIMFLVMAKNGFALHLVVLLKKVMSL